MSRSAPLVFPATAARHTATVIFAHGLGDSGHGWASAVENWRRRQRLDEVKFVLPHAPAIPITLNAGYRMPGWYDIVSPVSSLASLSLEELTAHLTTIDGSVDGIRRNEDERGIVASRDYFHKLVQAEIDAGIPADRIVLGGFSQGGAMSIFSGITSPHKIAGIVAMSAYVVLSLKLESTYLPKGAANVNAQTPILECHGSADQMVPTKLGMASRDLLVNLGYPVDWKMYSGMGHSACPEELDDVEAFLHKVLPPKEDGKSEL